MAKYEGRWTQVLRRRPRSGERDRGGKTYLSLKVNRRSRAAPRPEMRLAKHNLRSGKASPFCSLWCVRNNWKCPRGLEGLLPFLRANSTSRRAAPFRGRIASLLSREHNGPVNGHNRGKLAFNSRISRFVAVLCKYSSGDHVWINPCLRRGMFSSFRGGDHVDWGKCTCGLIN